MKFIPMLTLLISSSAIAMPIPPEEALTKALSALPHETQFRAPSLHSYTLTSSIGNGNIYVFNSSDGGFIIASGDSERSTPLLGYSSEGFYDSSDVPPALIDMLNAYSNGVWETSPGSPQQEISPILTTHWNQDEPYFNHCPIISSGRTMTGCAATAISQVLKTYQYPECGSGVAYAQADHQPVSLNLDEHPIDWANLRDSYSSEYTEDEAEAVANLMHVVGMAINMSYGTSASGAYPRDYVLGLVNHLGYDRSLRSLRRDFFSLDQWNTMLHAELSSGHPIIYSGFNEYGGHCFVIDGYIYEPETSNAYFHVNWGWSGKSDGYFLVTALNPSEQGIGGSPEGYNKNQEAIFNLQPDQGTEYLIPEIGLYGPFGVKSASIMKDKDPEFCASGAGINNYEGFYNVGVENISVYLGIKLVDKVTGKIDYVASDTYSTLNTTGRERSYTISADRMPTEGTYTVTPAFLYDGIWYEIGQDYTTRTDLTLTVTDKRFKFTSKPYGDQSGITEISTGISRESTTYYDLMGRPIAEPIPGSFYILKGDNKVTLYINK